jgi:hypothetical protein
MSNSRHGLFQEIAQPDAALVAGGACSCDYSYQPSGYSNRGYSNSYSAYSYTNYKPQAPASFESAANHLDQVLLG